MIKALRVVRKFTPSVAVNRYDSMGALTALTCRAMFKKFSSDAKRKTAAYDRIGYTLPDEALLAGETALANGDVLLYDGGNTKFIVGNLVSSQYWVPRGPYEAALIFEALYCNARVNIRNSDVATNSLTGQISTPTDPAVFSNIPVSIASAETFETEPLYEIKDHFFMGIPGTMQLSANQVVEILPFSDTDGMLEHATYRIEYPIVDSVGVRKYRIQKNQDGY